MTTWKQSGSVHTARLLGVTLVVSPWWTQAHPWQWKVSSAFASHMHGVHRAVAVSGLSASCKDAKRKAEEMAGAVCQACDLLGEAVKGSQQ